MAEQQQEEEWHPSEALGTDHAARKLWLVKVLHRSRCCFWRGFLAAYQHSQPY